MTEQIVVVLPARVDVATSAEVRVLLHDALDAHGGDLVIDLRDVQQVDAAGLGVLVGARRRADIAGRSVVLRQTPERFRRILAATRLKRLFVVEDDPEAADGRRRVG